jgi:hypothetical protein
MGRPETRNAKNACLALQSQAYRFLHDAIMLQAVGLPKQERSKKVISLKRTYGPPVCKGFVEIGG